jgi:hypothetical protein
VLTGDTRFHGGAGVTGGSLSHEPMILTSNRQRLLSLPADIVVHARHRESSTVADVQKDVDGALGCSGLPRLTITSRRSLVRLRPRRGWRMTDNARFGRRHSIVDIAPRGRS